MARTRRQTGAIVENRPQPAQEKMDVDEAELSELSDLEDSDVSQEEDEEESEFEESKPVAKRRKIVPTSSAIATGAKPTPKSRRKTLSLFPTMPLDVLFEILSYLGPKDLLRVSRTNTLFCHTLRSSNATTVWKTARESMKAPEPPADFDEPRWAALLFDTACQSCGTTGVPKIDFQIRRRVCVSCKHTHLVWSSKFRSRFPNYDDTILNYIPYTNVGGFAHGHASNSRFYWDADIENTAKEWYRLHSDIHMRKPNAKAALDAFKARRADLVDTIQEHAPTFRKWADTTRSHRWEESDANKRSRLEAVQARLMALGYTQADVSAIRIYDIGSGGAEVTNRGWARLRLKYEPIAQAAKERRLFKEKRGIVERRTDILKGLYQSFKMSPSISTSDLAFYPLMLDLCLLPQILSLVEADPEVDVTAYDFKPIADDLPNLIAGYIAEKKEKLRQMIPRTEPASESAVDSLELATSIFRCGEEPSSSYAYFTSRDSHNVLVGWPGVGTHHCVIVTYRDGVAVSSVKGCSFNLEASQIAAYLVRTSGLSPSTATIESMDSKNYRFVCKTCPVAQYPSASRAFEGYSGNRTHGYCAFTWRYAIGHSLQEHKGKAPLFSLVDPEEARQARQKEGLRVHIASAWCCNRCKEYTARTPQTKQYIENHLRTAHGVEQPRIKDDYFMDEGYRMDYEFPVVVPVVRKQPTKVGTPQVAQTGSDYTCLHCTGAGSNRRFILMGVNAHLKDKHAISPARPDVDWKCWKT